jgi:hypothetical protein
MGLTGHQTIYGLHAYSSPFGHPFQCGFGHWFQSDSAAGSGRLSRTDGARRRGRVIVTR